MWNWKYSYKCIPVYVKIKVPPHTKHIVWGRIQTVNSLYSFTALPVESFYQMQNYIFLIVLLWETGVHITFNTTKPEGSIPFGRYRCSTGVHKSQVNTFCMVTPNVYRSLVWKLLHVTLLAPRIFEWFLGVWKIWAPLLWDNLSKVCP